jgi:hypothetical protein
MSKIILPYEIILYIKRFREAHPTAKLFYDFFKHYNLDYKNIWDKPPIKLSFMNFYFSVRRWSMCTTQKNTSWINREFPQFFILSNQLKIIKKNL